MSALNRKVGQRIAEQRRLAGLSQAQLAERVGFATETISRMETGAAMPSLARIDSIARALDVDLAELFRFRSRTAPEDVAIERLVWLMSRRTASEIGLVIDVAARIVEHLGPAAR